MSEVGEDLLFYDADWKNIGTIIPLYWYKNEGKNRHRIGENQAIIYIETKSKEDNLSIENDKSEIKLPKVKSKKGFFKIELEKRKLKKGKKWFLKDLNGKNIDFNLGASGFISFAGKKSILIIADENSQIQKSINSMITEIHEFALNFNSFIMNFVKTKIKNEIEGHSKDYKRAYLDYVEKLIDDLKQTMRIGYEIAKNPMTEVTDEMDWISAKSAKRISISSALDIVNGKNHILEKIKKEKLAYENIIIKKYIKHIINFLKKLIIDLEKKIDNFKKNIPQREYKEDNEFEKNKKSWENKREKAENLYEKLSEQKKNWDKLREQFSDIPDDDIVYSPNENRILCSDLYLRFMRSVKKILGNNVDEPPQNITRFAQGVKRVSEIYEIWTFFKVIEAFENLEFKKKKDETISFETINGNVVPKPSIINMKNEQAGVSVEISYDIITEENGYKTHSNKLKSKNGKYYSPDIIVTIKDEKSKKRTKLIFDAKFKKYDQVIESLLDIWNKYYEDADDPLLDIWNEYDENVKSVVELCLTDKNIEPFFGEQKITEKYKNFPEMLKNLNKETNFPTENPHSCAIIPISPKKGKENLEKFIIFFLIYFMKKHDFCWKCNSEMKEDKKYNEKYNGAGRYVCNNCTNWIVVTSCQNCGSKIVKYIETCQLEDEEYYKKNKRMNIICPACGRKYEENKAKKQYNFYPFDDDIF